MINKVTLIGHLGQDPEIKRLENGTPVGRFSLATSETYKDANHELKTDTEWHNITVWRAQAENAEKLLKKGSTVYLEGKITYREYKDKNGVEKRSTDIVCSNFRILDKKDKQSTGEAIKTPQNAIKDHFDMSEVKILKIDTEEDKGDLPF